MDPHLKAQLSGSAGNGASRKLIPFCHAWKGLSLRSLSRSPQHHHDVPIYPSLMCILKRSPVLSSPPSAVSAWAKSLDIESSCVTSASPVHLVRLVHIVVGWSCADSRMRRWILRRSTGSEERERLEAEKVTAMMALMSSGSRSI